MSGPSPYDAALAKLAKLEAEVYGIKQWINQGCEFAGEAPMFPDAQAPNDTPGRGMQVGVDDFFNKPMATAVREVLTMRKDSGTTGPASIDDIHAVLKQGGFNFPSNDIDKQKMGLAVSLGKNTVTFRKLPNGLFGLADWYGSNRAQHSRRPTRLITMEGDGGGDEDDNEFNARDLSSEHDEAPESLVSDNSEASDPTPNSADEDGREVEHENMNP